MLNYFFCEVYGLVWVSIAVSESNGVLFVVQCETGMIMERCVLPSGFGYGIVVGCFD